MTRLLTIAAGLLLAALPAAPAAADHEHYTDGTETYPPTCYADPSGGPDWCLGEDGWGPPVLVRVDVDRCVAVFDPPHWIWLTAHVVRTDGTRSHVTVPYEHDRPGEVDIDLTPYVDADGRVSDVWATWNIGSGESAHTGPIDCDPDHPEPPDTSTSTTSTTTPPVTVDIGTPATATPTTSAPPAVAETLPETGSSGLLVWVAVGALAGGAAALLAGRRGSR